MGYNDNRVFNPRLQEQDPDVNDIDLVNVESGNTDIIDMNDINNIKDSRGILNIINNLNIKINTPNKLNYVLTYIGNNYPVNKDSDIELEERLDIFMYLYTKYNYTPFLNNFAAMCGITTETMRTWSDGAYRVGSSHSVTVKKCREFCESALVQDGMHARNPAMQIFLLKNNHGYQDKVEIVASQGDNNAPEKTPEEIAREYALDDKNTPPEVDF